MDQDSNVSYEQPLSPVLSSSSTKRKIIKRKKKSATATNSSHKINIDVQSNIERAENIINTQIISKHNSELVEQQVDSHSYELTKPTHRSNETPVLGFQSASGKQFTSKKLSSEDAKHLFGEIINPTIETHRENKFNFLSRKNKISDINSVTSTDFLGFNERELIDSEEKLNYVKYLQKALASSPKCFKANVILEQFDNKKRKLCPQGRTMNVSNSKSDVNNGKSATFVPELSNEIVVPSCMKICQEGRAKSEEIQISKNSRGEVNEVTRRLNSFHDSSSGDMKNINEFTANTKENIPTKTVLSKDFKQEEYSGYPNARIGNFNAFNEEMSIMRTVNGFSTASGKKIEISAKNFSKINHMFKDISEEEFIETDNARLKVLKNESFEYNTGKTEVDEIPESYLELLVDSEENNIVFKQGFSTASCKYPGTPSKEFTKINKLSNPNFKIEISESLSIHCKSSIPKLRDELESVEIKGFSTASGNTIQIPAASLVRINNLFKDIPDLNAETLISNTPEIDPDDSKITKYKDERNVMKGFSTASGTQIEIPASSLSKLGKIFGDIPDINLQTTASNVEKVTENIQNVNQSNSSAIQVGEGGNITPIRPIPRKKKLGSSCGINGKVSDTTMNRVKCLFSDINFDDLKLPGYSKASPRVSCSTPLRPNGSVSTPHFPKTFIPTPQAKRSFTNKNGSFLNDMPHEYNCPFLIQKPTSGDLKSWAEDLARQKTLLEKKLSMVSKRYEAISAQMEADSQTDNSKPQCMGKKINKIRLKDVAELEMQHEKVENLNNVILQINPQNAALIHFNGNWSDVATVTTTDGCTLIPNQQGLIGLSEIGAALESLPHIKKHLIPDGWIKNHYKWIIWKLASYERFFPSALGGSFTIDNVMKQLQYRYNREIYNAERPALRKIYEMDDVSQKRIILCISNIFKGAQLPNFSARGAYVLLDLCFTNGETIDLELTDGWYSIRTLIDDLLCSQVNRKKIRIGSKLIISGAELMNCDGCHPLETEQASKVRLKIYYNSTRRAAWFCKLGYQKNPRPLLINLNCAQPAGGIIGAIKVYVARVYPLVYMEKTNNSNIWRNQNAELKIMQAFENACYNEYEGGTINHELKKRNVIPVLQMTVVNAFRDGSKPFKCTVWNSTDFHAEQLKENKIISLYNLTMRSRNELSCNMKTRLENSNEDVSKYADYRRKYVPLNNISSMLINSDFKEFDTVGFVVEIYVGKQSQYFWLTDLYNLLLVEINESPENCLLLNRIQENQLIAVCNINFTNDYIEYSLAKAGFHSILTNYPQHTFLRDELMRFNQINENDLNTSLKKCKAKINSFNGEKHSNTSDGIALHASQITNTDIVMSMINIDEVINNTK